MQKNTFGEVEWIIHLADNRLINFEEGVKKQQEPPIDIIIEAKDSIPPPEPIEQEQEALQALQEIVEACKEIKGECLEALTHQEEKEIDEQAADVSKNLNGLFKIIMEFTKLLKKLGKRDEEPEKGE